MSSQKRLTSNDDELILASDLAGCTNDVFEVFSLQCSSFNDGSISTSPITTPFFNAFACATTSFLT